MFTDEQKQFEELKLKVDDLYYTVSKKLGLGSNDIKGSVMRSTNFLTGTRGWRITPDGTAEFQDIITPGLARFGGTGANGALSISSGTTTLDLGGVRVFTRNYTSISITGTGALAFSNPHAEGTTVLLRSQGDVTGTSSAAAMIDLRSLGGTGGIGGAGGNGAYSTPGKGLGIGGASAGLKYTPGTTFATGNGGAGGGCASSGTDGALGTAAETNQKGYGGKSVVGLNIVTLWAESGGGGSGGTGAVDDAVAGAGGAGGRGAGGLVIECKGALNITGTINASGAAGVDGASNVNGNGSGGGGGAGGQILIAYITLTADTGTYTVTGGAAGAAGSDAGGGTAGAAGAGSAGESLIVDVG